VGTAEPTYPSTARDHFWKLFFEAVDHLMSIIKERFNWSPSLETLLIIATNGEDTSKEVDDLVSKFSGDVNVTALTREVPLRSFQDISTAVKGLRPSEQQLIDNTIVVCKLIHVKPSTSARGERFFSTAKRIKTWLRSRMLQELSNISPF